MTSWMLWSTVGALSVLTLMQAIYVWLYLRHLRQKPSFSRPEDGAPWQPQTAVILCLRGTDPSLPACLKRLLNLGYSNYQLHLVFDDHDDPAFKLCQQVEAEIESAIATYYHVVQDHGSNRSLKCSALITSILELDETVEVVALVDADAIVDKDWLDKLVAPLADPTIGATTGNRWFAPLGSGIGTTLRKIWNGAALPQMSLYRIAWGGSLALRREVIGRCELLDHWSTAFCEDTMLSSKLGEYDLQVYRVPDLIIVNQESTTLWDALAWIGRQLLTVRLYHRGWTWVLAHALLGAVCLFIPPLIALWFLIRFEFAPMGIVLLATAVCQLINLVLIQLIEVGNRTRIHRAQRSSHASDIVDASVAEPPMRDLGPFCVTPAGLFAFVLLQIFYPFLAIGAALQQRVRWRGIDYRIGSKKRIEMVEYRRFVETLEPEKTGTDHSIS